MSGLWSFFKTTKTKNKINSDRSMVSPADEKGGAHLRSLAKIISKLPAEDADAVFSGIFSVSVASFEEAYVNALAGRQSDPSFREAYLFSSMVSNLFNKNYIGFLALHTLTYADRAIGRPWSVRSTEEIQHVGKMASLFLVNPHYQLTENQIYRQNEILKIVSNDDFSIIISVIKSENWDLIRTILCSVIARMAKNIMEIWAGPDAHEQVLYQTFMLSLRVDNCIGALLLHHWAMAHHLRGWDWRPSPSEFDAIAENLARKLVDKRHNLGALRRN